MKFYRSRIRPLLLWNFLKLSSESLIPVFNLNETGRATLKTYSWNLKQQEKVMFSFDTGRGYLGRRILDPESRDSESRDPESRDPGWKNSRIRDKTSRIPNTANKLVTENGFVEVGRLTKFRNLKFVKFAVATFQLLCMIVNITCKTLSNYSKISEFIFQNSVTHTGNVSKTSPYPYKKFLLFEVLKFVFERR
jgi:hypothetical protein